MSIVSNFTDAAYSGVGAYILFFKQWCLRTEGLHRKQATLWSMNRYAHINYFWHWFVLLKILRTAGTDLICETLSPRQLVCDRWELLLNMCCLVYMWFVSLVILCSPLISLKSRFYQMESWHSFQVQQRNIHPSFGRNEVWYVGFASVLWKRMLL